MKNLPTAVLLLVTLTWLNFAFALAEGKKDCRGVSAQHPTATSLAMDLHGRRRVRRRARKAPFLSPTVHARLFSARPAGFDRAFPSPDLPVPTGPRSAPAPRPPAP